MDHVVQPQNPLSIKGNDTSTKSGKADPWTKIYKQTLT